MHHDSRCLIVLPLSSILLAVRSKPSSKRGYRNIVLKSYYLEEAFNVSFIQIEYRWGRSCEKQSKPKCFS